MLSHFTTSLVIASGAKGKELPMDPVLYGVIIFAALMIAMFVTMSFSKAANRNPDVHTEPDPHRAVHARPQKN